jgi:hypothetical protein
MAARVPRSAPTVRRARQAKRKVTGLVLYRGPSLYTGGPIVVIATGLGGSRSSNRKTGEMVQTYILADVGEEPQAAIKSGADASV